MTTLKFAWARDRIQEHTILVRFLSVSSAFDHSTAFDLSTAVPTDRKGILSGTLFDSSLTNLQCRHVNFVLIGLRGLT